MLFFFGFNNLVLIMLIQAFDTRARNELELKTVRRYWISIRKILSLLIKCTKRGILQNLNIFLIANINTLPFDDNLTRRRRQNSTRDHQSFFGYKWRHFRRILSVYSCFRPFLRNRLLTHIKRRRYG
jgi:hypothetical protein